MEHGDDDAATMMLLNFELAMNRKFIWILNRGITILARRLWV